MFKNEESAVVFSEFLLLNGQLLLLGVQEVELLVYVVFDGVKKQERIVDLEFLLLEDLDVLLQLVHGGGANMLETFVLVKRF